MRSTITFISLTVFHAVAPPDVVLMQAQNAVVPQYALREEIRIASDESSADRTLTLTSQLVVLRDGSIAVGQSRERTVRVYDQNGKFVRNIGRPGSGPGELTSLNRIGVIGDTLWLHNTGPGGRFALFRPDGTFIRNAMYTAAPYSGIPYAYLGNKRLFVIVEYQNVPAGALRATAGSAKDSTHYVVTDTSQKPLFTIFKQPRDPAGMIPFTDGALRMYMEQPLMAKGLWAVEPGSGDVVMAIDPQFGGRAGVVTLIRCTSSGGVSKTEITFPVQPITAKLLDSLRNLRGMRAPQTDQERARRESLLAAFARRMHVPSQAPILWSIVAGRDRSVWLRDYMNPELWHVVEGNRITRQVTIPRELSVLQASSTQVWGIRSDSLGVATVYRFALRPTQQVR